MDIFKTYLQSSRSQIYFWVPNTSPVPKFTFESKIHIAIHVLAIFQGTIFAKLWVPDISPDIKYTFGSRVHVMFHVLDIFNGICNPPSSRYTPGSQVYPRFPDISLGLRYTSGF